MMRTYKKVTTIFVLHAHKMIVNYQLSNTDVTLYFFHCIDTMDKWDQQKLEEVVNKKHGSEKAKPRTEIVS